METSFFKQCVLIFVIAVISGTIGAQNQSLFVADAIVNLLKNKGQHVEFMNIEDRIIVYAFNNFS